MTSLSSATDTGAITLTDHSEDYAASQYWAGYPLESADVAALVSRARAIVQERKLLLPDQDVLLAETFNRVMDRLTVADRAVVQLALQGQQVSDISAAVGRTPRAVYRVLQSVRELLSAQSIVSSQ